MSKRLNHIHQFVIGIGRVLDPFTFVDQRAYIRPSKSDRKEDLVSLRGDVVKVSEVLCTRCADLGEEERHGQPYRDAGKGEGFSRHRIKYVD